VEDGIAYIKKILIIFAHYYMTDNFTGSKKRESSIDSIR